MFRKRNKSVVPQYESDVINRIPERIKSLLYFSNDEPTEAIRQTEITVDFFTGVTVDEKKRSNDPSTIFVDCLVQKPEPNEFVEGLGYYPTYAGMTPEQRWVYLNWLEDISREIDIGYVFVFYYGLERQLLIGDFDGAFDVIIELKKYHQNNSFQGYSTGSLVYATIIKNRQDKLNSLQFVFDAERWGNTELLVAYKSQPNLSAYNVMNVMNNLKGVNKRYLTNNRDVYQSELKKILRKRFSVDSFPLRETVDIISIPRTATLAFANISFPDEVRSIQVPDVLNYGDFSKLIVDVANSAHEATKERLRRDRKK